MLENDDIEQLKEIFITKKECDEIQDKTKEFVHSIDKRLAIIENNGKKTQWILRTILGTVISLLIGAIWAIIQKGV